MTDHKVGRSGHRLPGLNVGSWRAGAIPLLLLLALVLSGPRLLGRAWGNVGLVALTRALVAATDAATAQGAGQAEALLRRAVAFSPANRSAWRGLGFALAAQGREDEALAAWRNAGDVAEELVQWGEQARQRERYQDALAWHRRALLLAPDWGAPWFFMGLVYEDLEMWDDAVEAFQEAESQADSIEDMAGSLYLEMGLALHKRTELSDLPGVLKYYEAALASDHFIHRGERTNVHYNRGVVLFHLGRVQEARQEFEWVLGVEPEHYWARAWLGRATWRGDRDLLETKEHLQQAIALRPEESWAYLLLGLIYQQAGYLEEAAEMYRQVLEIEPGNKAALDFFSNHKDQVPESRSR